MSNQQPPLPCAGVTRRLAAIIYDSLLVFGVMFAATLPTLLFETNDSSPIENEQVVHELHPLIAGWPFQVYLALVFVAFFSWFWRKNGQTLGMQAWRLQVETFDGERISLAQCLLRLASPRGMPLVRTMATGKSSRPRNYLLR